MTTLTALSFSATCVQSNAVLIYSFLFYNYQIESVFQKILRAFRIVPLVKEAKFAKNFCVPTLAASLFQSSNVRNYPAHFGLSATHFCNAAKNFLTQETAKDVLKSSFCFMLKFYVSIVFF